jgi:Zn-dependent peptidase ImmA (M78 family)
MSDSSANSTWPAVIAEAAKAPGMSLPEATQRGMGSVLWRNPAGDRFVSFRPLLGMPPDPNNAKARWSLWHDENDQPRSVLVFHLPLRPVSELALQVASVLQGWLLEQWSDQAAEQHVTAFAKVEIPPESSEPVANEHWLCENHGFGVILESDGWEIRAGTRSLSTWKSKVDGSRGRLLTQQQLDRFCGWLARNWYVIAYGKYPRPPRLREREVAACHAYEAARTDATPQELAELQSWWGKHAFRAADPELPNVFLERQGDDLVISWDESPSETRAFMIPYGTEITSARFAVPILRRLVGSRIANVKVEPKFEKRVIAVDPEVGYRALGSTFPGITPQWLIAHRFSDEDARDMALTGTARHPVVGLLRSAQGSTISLADFETILAMLQPNPGNRFQNLRALAKGKNANIDLREPWRSGYHLARLVRAELGQQETGHFDIEAAVQSMSIDVRELSLTDPTILAACVGSPQFAPLIAINTACPDATGKSGRRVTLAHELCHLLFDRSRMQRFARFEGGAAESDRLIEMRANAFAVELLAPIKSFVKPDGTLMTDEEAETLSPQLEVSTVAIRRHVQNHRNQQRRFCHEFV